MVPAEVKTAADLKGKRLSAAGGVGGFNWLMGREILRTANLTQDDAQFISQGTAGRLPGFLAGQIEGVALHPEDVFLVQQKKPGARILTMLSDLLPNYAFNHYGASDAMIAKDRALLRRHHCGDDRGEPRDLSRQGQGDCRSSWRRRRSRRTRSNTRSTC